MNGAIVLVKAIVDNRPLLALLFGLLQELMVMLPGYLNVMGDNIEIGGIQLWLCRSYNKRIIKANTMTGFIHLKI